MTVRQNDRKKDKLHIFKRLEAKEKKIYNCLRFCNVESKYTHDIQMNIIFYQKNKTAFLKCPLSEIG
jgi:hypothetical protein